MDSNKERSVIGRLHVITDFHFQQKFSHAELAAMATRGGADTIQFRQKRGSDRHIHQSAKATSDVLKLLLQNESLDISFIIDDHISVAILLNAQGVHLGQNDLPVAATRIMLDDPFIIGASASTLVEALAAESQGASYIGFGPVYPTRSKNNPSSVKGLSGLEKVCDAVSIPVIAIGGVTPDVTRNILEAGAHGVAVMTNITTADDPQAATRSFRTEINYFLDGKSA
jgi:thiamine-phosphate pyrophosphorylase